MSWVGVAVGGGSALAGFFSSRSQRKASERASEAQIQASREAIAEQRRQFNQVRELLSPYVQAGETALTQQQALIGLGGDEAQQQAIDRLESSPQFQALTQQGEEAILANASATGGLRGGNTQAALLQYRPQVLSNLIDQQYNRFAGLTNLGQSSAVGVGAAGQSTGANISNLYGDIGASQAGRYLTQGQSNVGNAIQQGITTGLLTGSLF